MKLWQYVIRRLVLLVPVMIGISVITFALAWSATDGHLEYQYFDESDRLTERQIQAIIQQNGFDRPAYLQYFSYLQNLVQGDWGTSTSVNDEVTDVIARKFPASAELALVAMIFAVAFGIPMGILSATHRDRPIDHVTRFVSLSGVSVPVFWLALILQLSLYYLLRVHFGITFFPLNARFDPGEGFAHPSLHSGPTNFLLIDTLIAGDFHAFGLVARHLILPGFTLAFVTLAIIARMMRASMLEVLNLDYVRTARAKGLEERVVVNRHARRNALIPTITVVGLSLGGLMGGAVLTESIFSWPGLGGWAAGAMLSLDISAILGFVTVTAFLYVLANLIVDVIYAHLDPRVRLE